MCNNILCYLSEELPYRIGVFCHTNVRRVSYHCDSISSFLCATCYICSPILVRCCEPDSPFRTLMSLLPLSCTVEAVWLCYEVHPSFIFTLIRLQVLFLTICVLAMHSTSDCDNCMYGSHTLVRSADAASLVLFVCQGRCWLRLEPP